MPLFYVALQQHQRTRFAPICQIFLDKLLGKPLDRLSTQDVAAVKLAYDFARYWSELVEAELLKEGGSSEPLEVIFQRLSYLGSQKN
jgi:hypothetical protein